MTSTDWAEHAARALHAMPTDCHGCLTAAILTRTCRSTTCAACGCACAPATWSK